MLKFQVYDTEKVIKNLDRQTKQLIPAAVSKGLNRGTFDVRDVVKSRMPVYIDRPTPFTLRALAVKKSIKSRLISYIFIQPKQAKYLRHIILGGTTPEKHVVPSRQWPLNAYGNLASGTTKQKNVFVNNKRGRRYYFKRRGGKKSRDLQLIGHIPPTRSYGKTFPFFYVAGLYIPKWIPKRITKEVRRVLQKEGV